MADQFLNTLLHALKEQQTKDVNESARLKGQAMAIESNVQERAGVIRVLEKTLELGVPSILNKF